LSKWYARVKAFDKVLILNDCTGWNVLIFGVCRAKIDSHGLRLTKLANSQGGAFTDGRTNWATVTRAGGREKYLCKFGARRGI
jgi:hypothetical protein